MSDISECIRMQKALSDKENEGFSVMYLSAANASNDFKNGRNFVARWTKIREIIMKWRPTILVLTEGHRSPESHPNHSAEMLQLLASEGYMLAVNAIQNEQSNMSFGTQIFFQRGVRATKDNVGVISSAIIDLPNQKNTAKINRIPILTFDLPIDSNTSWQQTTRMRMVGFHGTLDHTGPDVLNVELAKLKELLDEDIQTFIIGDFNLITEFRDKYIMLPDVFGDLATFACFSGDHLPAKVVELLEKAGDKNIFRKFPDGTGMALSQLDGFFTSSKAKMDVRILNPVTGETFTSRDEQFEFFKNLVDPGANIVSDHFPIVVDIYLE